MTLEEAIIHCKEKACGNTQCAIEHGQLAEWLQELQQYRKNAKKEEIKQYLKDSLRLSWEHKNGNYYIVLKLDGEKVTELNFGEGY